MPSYIPVSVIMAEIAAELASVAPGQEDTIDVSAYSMDDYYDVTTSVADRGTCQTARPFGWDCVEAD